ncbi:hypothetical protein HY632_05355 [Candidatus Uhrbacteria bacterium]|nr:hypothetical protein [Candidatus Uhrbacteria bacterium]
MAPRNIGPPQPAIDLTFAQIRMATAGRIRILVADTRSIEGGNVSQSLEHLGKAIDAKLRQLEEIESSFRSLRESVRALQRGNGTDPPRVPPAPPHAKPDVDARNGSTPGPLNEEQKDSIRRRLLLAIDRKGDAYQAERDCILREYPTVTAFMLNGLLASARNATSGPPFALRELARTPVRERMKMAEFLAIHIPGTTARELLEMMVKSPMGSAAASP